MASSSPSSALQDLYRSYKLSEASNCIRLLRIKERVQDCTPNGDLKQLKCSFEVFELSQVPDFVALSYTWGVDEYVHGFLKIDNLDIPIRKNLFDALRHICRPHGPVQGQANLLTAANCLYLWADYLCIDQDSVMERNHQVQLMGRIYRKATSVAAYIGSAENESSKVMDILRLHDSNRLPVGMRPRLNPNGDPQDHEEKAINKEVYTRMEQMLMTIDDVHKAYKAFSEREYWTRLWIVQEFVLPETLWIYAGYDALRLSDGYGNRLGERLLDPIISRLNTPEDDYDARANTMQERDLDRIMSRLSNPEDDYEDDDDALANTMQKLLNERAFRHNQHIHGRGIRDMSFFCKTWARQKCKDPRDHIFGLISLSHTPEDWPRVDYSMSVEEVYAEAVRKYLLKPEIGINQTLLLGDSLKETLLEALGVDPDHPTVRSSNEDLDVAISQEKLGPSKGSESPSAT